MKKIPGILSVFVFCLHSVTFTQEIVIPYQAAFIVKPDGTLVEATSARVGQTIEYVFQFKNESSETIPKENVVLTGPIPEGSTYVPGSATIYPDYRVVELATGIQWTLIREMWPGEILELRYRVVVGGTPTTTTYSSQTSSSSSIYSNCKDKWGSDTQMVDYCVENQTQAQRNISSYQGPIKASCEAEWETDYEMVLYCIKNQTASSIAVSSAPNDEIKQYCSNQWGTDYEMVEYCMKNQRAAKLSIQQFSGPVRKACEKEWGVDYEMVEYCIKNQ